VVVKVWHEVANNLSEISMEIRMVREDLSHPDWEGLPLAEPSPSKKSVKDSLFSESMDGTWYCAVRFLRQWRRFLNLP